jgi:hypothetical protein
MDAPFVDSNASRTVDFCALGDSEPSVAAIRRAPGSHLIP